MPRLLFLTGLVMSAGPGYMPKYPSLNEPYAGVAVEKIKWAISSLALFVVFALFFGPRVIPTRGGLC
jgi:hypothetical protein